MGGVWCCLKKEDEFDLATKPFKRTPEAEKQSSEEHGVEVQLEMEGEKVENPRFVRSNTIKKRNLVEEDDENVAVRANNSYKFLSSPKHAIKETFEKKIDQSSEVIKKKAVQEDLPRSQNGDLTSSDRPVSSKGRKKIKTSAANPDNVLLPLDPVKPRNSRRRGSKSKKSVSSSSEQTLISEEEIRVPPGPLGLLLSRQHKNLSVVDGFNDLPDKTKGEIEKSGKVHRGSMLCKVNGVDVMNKPLEQVIQLLQQTQNLPRVLTFRKSRHQFDDI